MDSVLIRFKMFLRRGLMFSVLVLACTVGIASASADTHTWDGGVDPLDLNWSTCANWNATGAPDVCPVVGDAVIFDGTSTKNCTIDASAIASITTFNLNSGYTGTITQARSFTVSGATTIAGAGVFTGSTDSLTFSGAYNQSAGIFNAGNQTITFSSTFTQSGGTFNGAGTLNFIDTFTLNSGAIFISTSGTANFTGNFTVAEGAGADAWQHNNGTVVFNGSSLRVIQVDSTNAEEVDEEFFNFQMNKTAGATLAGVNLEIINVTGTLTLTDGCWATAGAVLNATGAVSIANTLDTSVATLNVTGDASRTMTIASGGVHFPIMTINAPNLTIDFTGTSATTFDRTVTLQAGTFTQDSSALTFSEAFSQTGGAFNLTGGQTTTFSSTFTQSGGTFNGAGTLNFTGTFTLNSGAIFISTSGTANFAGYFTVAEGAGADAWQHNNGTVVFNGSASATINVDSINVEADEVFFNFQLNKTAGASFSGVNLEIINVTGALTLTDGSWRTAGAVLNATGAVSIANTLDSGSVATLNVTGDASRTMTIASGLSVFPIMTINAPNLTVNFTGIGSTTFDKAFTLQAGTFNSDSSTTFSSTFTQSGGTFNGAGTLNFTDTFTLNSGAIFISTSGTANFTGNFTVAEGAGADAWQHNNGTVVFNGSASATINVDSTNAEEVDEEFFNFQMNKTTGATLAGVNLEIINVTGTLTLTDGRWATAGAVLNATGAVSIANTLDNGSATLNVTGDASRTMTIASGLSVFPIMTINAPNLTVNFTGIGSTTFDKAFTLQAGTFNSDSSMYFNDSFTLSGGSFYAPSGNLTVSGSWTHTAGGTFYPGTGTVVYTGNNQTWNFNTSETFYNFTINSIVDNAFTIASGDTMIVLHNLNLLDCSVNTGTLQAMGNVTVGSAFGGGNSPLVFAGTGAQNFDLTGGTANFNGAITVNNADAVVTLLSDLTMNNTQTFTLTNGEFNVGAHNFSLNAAFSQSGGVFNGGSLTNNIDSSFTLSGGDFYATSGTMSVQTSWTHTAGGTFHHMNGTVSFDHDAAGTFSVTTSETFYNFVVSKTYGFRALAISSGKPVIVGTGTICAGGAATTGGTIEAQGNFVVAGDCGSTNTTTLLFGGSAIQTFNATGYTGSLDMDITVNKTGGLVNLGSALTMNYSNQDLTIQQGTFDLNGYALSVTGGGTETIVVNNTGNLQLQGGETVTADSASYPQFDAGSTVTYDGAVGPYTMKDWTMTNATLVINGGASSVFTLGATETVANATITSGILSLGANGLTVSTAFSNDGTLRWRGSGTLSLPAMDTNSGTVEFTGDGDSGADTYTVTTLSSTYYNLAITSTDGATDIFQLGTALDVNGSLTITTGTFNVTGGNYAINVGRNFSNTGTFNSSSGTVVFDDATGTGTIAGSASFYNLSCVTANKLLVFTSGITQTITGVFTMTGSAGNTVVLRSSLDGVQWGLTIDGSSSISYVDVKDSNALGGNPINAKGTNSVNSGNNLGWMFNVAPTVASITAVELTNGSGIVNVSFILDDDDDDTNRALVEYNVGAGWIKATLSETSGTGSTYGQFNLENDNSYQVGNSNGYIWTSPGANTITAVWNSKTDAPMADLSTAQIRVTPYDGYDIGTPGTSSEFTMDNAGPAGGFAGFVGGAMTSSTITWNWTAGTDSHFNHYEVWYGTNETDVGNRNGTAVEWDNDPNDATLATATTATTTITGLLEDTTYYAKIWAVDGYGNETTLSVATANNNGKPTIGGVTIAQSVNGNQYVNVQFVMDDADDTNLGQVLIQYNIGEGWNKATIATSGTSSTYGSFFVDNDGTYQIGSGSGYVWSSLGANTINVVWRSDVDAAGINLETVQLKITPYDGIETGAVVTSDAFIVDGVAPTTPGTFTKSGGTGTTSILTWTTSTESHFNHYEIWYGTNQTDVNNRNGTAVEWDNDPNDVTLATKTTATTTVTGLTPGLTYYTKICSADNYGYESCGSVISFVTNQTPTVATVTAVQATDGTSNVTVTFIVDDADNDDTLQALVEYNVGAGWNKATLSETTGTGSTYGQFNLENDNTYQVGNGNGYVITSSGANTITVVWTSASDVTAIDTITAQVRATPYDGIIAGSAVASDNFTLDQVAPSGGLTSVYTSSITTSGMNINWIPDTTDTNFSSYKIYYKPSASLDYSLYSTVLGISSSSIAVSGLTSGNTYNFYVKSFDGYGNVHQSDVLTVATTSSGENSVVVYGGGSSWSSGIYNHSDDTVEEDDGEEVVEEEVSDEIITNEDTVYNESNIVEIDIESTDNLEEAVAEFDEQWESEVVQEIGSHWSEPYLKDFFKNTLLNEMLTSNDAVINYLFNPNQGVTRIEFLRSAMDLLGMEPSEDITDLPFADVLSNVSDAQYVMNAYEMGVITGYPDSTFRPNQYINRAEALKMVFIIAGIDVPMLTGNELLSYYNLPANPFTDVDQNAWYAPYLMFAYSKGIISGYGDGTFMPDRIISLGETAKIVVLVLQL